MKPGRWRFLAAWAALLLLCPDCVSAADLKPGDVANVKGDGPDGKGNTDDDTWGFWFELAHAPGKFARLDLATASLTPAVRKDGIARKVRGPIASLLPNPADSNGWIFHSDWDGRFEGIWADAKTAAILAHPYAEKQAHLAVAITWRVPKTASYNLSGEVTDLTVNANAPHDGITWRVEHVGTTVKLLDKGVLGDGGGRPESGSFTLKKIALKQGDFVRLVIHPNKWWGADLTRIDSFKAEESSD